MVVRSRAWWSAACALAGMIVVLLPAASPAQDSTAEGLPTVASGARPGPDVLYASPPRAPQLENTGVWQAEPILVSGAQAYRDGEWLYQDFLYDDHGATGVPDPEDPYGPSSNLYSPPAGTFTYPTDPVYARNAADLVELRVRPLDDATAVRLTLNTMLDPALVGATVALGDATSAAWPHAAGVTSPAEVFLTWHGDTAELVSAEDGAPLSPAPTAAVDLERRQVTLQVPHAAWNPGRDVVRVTVGVGLWDADTDGYLAPTPGPGSATTPGGGSLVGSSLVNVGPRFAEPTPFVAGVTMADTAVGARALAPWWRERDQSLQLAAGDVSPFFADVDFGRLADGVGDESGVPTSGPMNRIHASRYSSGQGIDADAVCFAISSEANQPGTECRGRYVGQLQPYAVYVPEGPPPSDGWGLTLLLHALSANHNQYLGTRHQTQLGDRAGGSIVITPEARGPDGFYAGLPEAATFEVWADVARWYPLDPDWASISGYSMGAFGTYRLMARWPDLFGAGFTVVGEPGSAADQLASLRNHRILSWVATADELVNLQTTETAFAAMQEAGLDVIHDLFLNADHLTLAAYDEYTPGAEFLGDIRADRDPPTISYVVDPTEDSADVVADHAYWLSELAVRDPAASPTATIEVHSFAFGRSRTSASPRPEGGGVLTGGTGAPLAYVERGVGRSQPDEAAAADRLEVTATNLARVVIDPTRARVTCDAEVVVDSDGPIEVVLAGCDDDAMPTTAPTSTPAPETGSGPSLPATGGGAVPLGLAVTAAALTLHTRRRAQSGDVGR